MRDPKRAADNMRRGGVHLALLVIGKRPTAVPSECLIRFREAEADTPVIIVTNDPNLDEAVEALRRHAYDYLDRKQLAQQLEPALLRLFTEKGYLPPTETELEQAIGGRLRQCRQNRGLTLKQLGTRTGLSVSMISQIETLKTSPSVGTLSRLTQALGITLEDLFEGF